MQPCMLDQDAHLPCVGTFLVVLTLLKQFSKGQCWHMFAAFFNRTKHCMLVDLPTGCSEALSEVKLHSALHLNMCTVVCSIWLLCMCTSSQKWPSARDVPWLLFTSSLAEPHSQLDLPIWR